MLSVGDRKRGRVSFIGEKLLKLKQPMGSLGLAKIFYPIFFCLSGCATYPVSSNPAVFESQLLDSDRAESSAVAQQSIDDVRRLAKKGNRYAQLELGKRYEAGDGLEKDLARAESLYFKAATSPGALTPTVISTPGGQSASITSYNRAPAQFNGLKEAAMRWARLANKSGQHSQSAVDQANLADQHGELGRQHQVAEAMYEPDLMIEARSELIRIYGYQPIFNNLKYRGKPWRETITTGGGARLINDEMVMHSFLYALDPPDETRTGETISADRIRAFCRQHISSAKLNNVADRRMAGLCALYRCDLVGAVHWQAMATGLKLHATEQKMYDRDAALSFLDASFLLRVASRCSEQSVPAKWEDLATLHLKLFESSKQHCRKEKCQGDIPYALRVARAGIANILFWAFENDKVDAPATQAAVRYWEVSDRAKLDGGVREERVAQHCETLGLEYAPCRMDHPYGYFLDGKVLALVKQLAEMPAAQRETVLQAFESRFGLEWKARRKS